MIQGMHSTIYERNNIVSLFENVSLAPADPILGVVEAFNQDTRSNKVNLSIGVYTNEYGKVPILEAVKTAQAHLISHPSPKTYLPIDGLKAYTQSVQALLFNDHAILQENRVATLQSLGGTGALKIGADFLKSVTPSSNVYVSDPTWDNHRAIFRGAGFTVSDYPYFDQQTGGVNFDRMIAFFKTLAPKSILILHTCCHNPTGADLTTHQWETLAEVIKAHDLIPFLDMAYQGFSKSVEDDAKPIHIMLKHNIDCFIASSFSKSFSLYGERVGALSVTTQSADEQKRVLSQLKQVVRGNYSSPPLHGAELAGFVLQSPELTQIWMTELGHMRDRIKLMRNKLVSMLNAEQKNIDFSFINAQVGMFSYSGLNAMQVDKMKAEHAVYTVGSGRICVAALNDANIQQAATAILSVI